MTQELFFTWVAAILTLSIFSFLIKDNPFYKFAEHLVVGVTAGYYVIIFYYNAVKPYLIDPLFKEHRYITIIPLILGLLMFTRFSSKYGWLSRWSLAFMIGGSSGFAIPRMVEQRLIKQAEATMIPLYGHELMAWDIINNWFIFAGVLATLIYFFFSREHKGVLGGIARVGIVFIMVGFGASFGYTVMARISLLIGRTYFLIHNWLGII